jgi:predicted metal-dependent hydrolase
MNELPGPVEWRRSARARYVSLRIDARIGAVVVTLPPRARRQTGLALLAEHAAWVRESLAALTPAVRFVPGAKLPIGGVDFAITLVPGAAGVLVENGTLRVSGLLADLRDQIAAFLRAEAFRRIGAVVARHAAALIVTPRRVRLKELRSRWGSCAHDGTLSFSWRLVMAPDWVLDYVVAHEVAHLRELNHSERFWAHVTALTPHRKAAIAWLKAHGPALLRAG